MLPNKQELSNLLGILYDAANDPTLWAPFIEELAGRTKSASAALLVQVFDRGLYSLSNSWRLPEEFLQGYQEHYHKLDAWAEVVFLKKPSGYVCTSQSLCPLPQLKKTEFYNDSLVRGGIEHGMFALVENSKSCLASVCLYRDRSRSEFTGSELQILRFLAPHLQRAFKLHFLLSELKACSSSFENALDMVPTGIALLSVNGDIVFMNRSASALVAEKDGLLVTSNRLYTEQHDESELLRSTIRQAVSDQITSAAGTFFISRRTRPPLRVLVSPIRASAVPLSQKIAVAVFIHDPSRPQRPADTLLRTLYGLTRAECRVALLLSDGRAPREIAGKIGVTENTVRSQIKSIYNKTGVKRQGELIRLLLNLSGSQI